MGSRLHPLLATLSLVILSGCGAGAPTVGVEAPAPRPATSVASIAATVPATPPATPVPPPTASPPASATTPSTVPDTPVAPVSPAAPVATDAALGRSVAVEKGTSGRREIALTFDAGADRGNGAAILDRLADYGVRASFGITGRWAEENPDLVRRMVAEGHLVFNHTWSHASWTGRSTSPDPDDPGTWDPLPGAERREELRRTEEAIRAIAGIDVRPYWRPAYGDYDADALVAAGAAGAAGYGVTVMWSCESFAWKGWSAEEIVAYCTTDMAPGDIVLLHVGAQGADYEALPGLIAGLAAQGFAFVTVEEILRP